MRALAVCTFAPNVSPACALRRPRAAPVRPLSREGINGRRHDRYGRGPLAVGPAVTSVLMVASSFRSSSSIEIPLAYALLTRGLRALLRRRIGRIGEIEFLTLSDRAWLIWSLAQARLAFPSWLSIP